MTLQTTPQAFLLTPSAARCSLLFEHERAFSHTPQTPPWGSITGIANCIHIQPGSPTWLLPNSNSPIRDSRRGKEQRTQSSAPALVRVLSPCFCGTVQHPPVPSSVASVPPYHTPWCSTVCRYLLCTLPTHSNISTPLWPRGQTHNFLCVISKLVPDVFSFTMLTTHKTNSVNYPLSSLLVCAMSACGLLH